MTINRIMLLGLLAGAAMTPTASLAQTRGGFEIGLEGFDYSYSESLEGETIVRDDGPFIGITLGYVQKLGDGWLLRGRLSGAAGSVDYRSDGGQERLDNVSQGIGHFELVAGRDFMVSERMSLTPFVGFATRVLNDESGGEETESGLLGYDRKLNYAYVPVGVALRHSTGRRGGITFSAQYNHVVGGEAESRFSDVNPELPDVKLDLNGGSGFELSAIADIPLGGNAIRVGPFVRGWSIDQSKSVILTNPEDPTEAVELFEPRNRTTEVGLRLSFAF